MSHSSRTPTPIADLRRDYAHASLDEGDVGTDPIDFFDRWLQEAISAELLEPTAMTLATSSPDGEPDARIVLLKGVDTHGFVFFTDYRSQKGEQLAANPRAALVFLWLELERQVRVTGTVTKCDPAESAAYFHTRPEKSRMGAWASYQSQVIANRAILEGQFDEGRTTFRGAPEIPLPPHWGGYRLAPDTIVFWQGRRSRLHDRVRFVRTDAAWRIERLSP